MSRLGVVADDFTGATDIAGNLRSRGFGTVVVTRRGVTRAPARAGATAAVASDWPRIDATFT